MKKTLLFMLNNMNVGGTEKAFLNLLEEIDEDEYEITLLLLDKSGGFMSQIPSYVNVISVKNYSEIEPLIKLPPVKSAKLLIQRHKIFKAIVLMVKHFVCKIKKDRTSYWNFIYNSLDLELPGFDIAVAYAGPYDLISTCILNCNAKTKVQWIHFDVSKIGFDVGYARNNYKKFDKVYVVSDYARKKLIDAVPEIDSITETKHNVISKSLCLKMADSFRAFETSFDGIRILTVGRLSKEKGQDVIPEIVSRLKSEGYKIQWFLVGDGNLRKDIEEKIDAYCLKDNLLLLGTKINPYPYYKECDLYVQTSYYEGYSVSILEAKVFNKFIISTDVSGVKEQINSKNEGVIIEHSADSIYYAIKEYMDKHSTF